MTNSSKMPAKLFPFTHFRKNTSATPLVSHTSKKTVGVPSEFTSHQSRAIHASPDSCRDESRPLSPFAARERI